jgi:hypothetical protein
MRNWKVTGSMSGEQIGHLDRPFPSLYFSRNHAKIHGDGLPDTTGSYTDSDFYRLGYGHQGQVDVHHAAQPVRPHRGIRAKCCRKRSTSSARLCAYAQLALRSRFSQQMNLMDPLGRIAFVRNLSVGLPDGSSRHPHWIEHRARAEWAPKLVERALHQGLLCSRDPEHAACAPNTE